MLRCVCNLRLEKIVHGIFQQRDDFFVTGFNKIMDACFLDIPVVGKWGKEHRRQRQADYSNVGEFLFDLA